MKFDTDLTRRRFVNHAAKSFLGVSALTAAPFGLRGAGEGASDAKQEATAKRVIYLYMNGGMSHLDTFDPKKDVEVMGATKQIRTKVDDLFFANHIPKLAKQADKLAVLRSMTSTQGAHRQGEYFMRTSYTMRSSIIHPAMGAWMTRLKGETDSDIPPNILIGTDSRHPGAGFMESRLSPLAIRDPEGGLKNVEMRKGVSGERFQFHRELAQKLDAPFMERYDQKNVRAYTDMYEDAIKLMKSDDLAAFDLSLESDRLRERYGKNAFGQGCLLARRLLENGVRYAEVTFGGWDTHNANFVRIPDQAKTLDDALSTLLADLQNKGMLEDTLVVLATEFGRTPIINVNEGRDHHPSCFSCVLAGGGIKGGQVLGETDETASKAVSDSVKVPDLNATIGYALGLPLDEVIFSPSMRPFTLADKGQPVVDLFG
ncbi:MAG: DUF1501 domain-containing protein [Verrucomicrobiales bacterium]|nr:DUF1501 domain-containing protein [Verrucomicrobiales bacterium]